MSTDIEINYEAVKLKSKHFNPYSQFEKRKKTQGNNFIK
jgi:hypothetical protein